MSKYVVTAIATTGGLVNDNYEPLRASPYLSEKVDIYRCLGCGYLWAEHLKCTKYGKDINDVKMCEERGFK